MFFKCPCVFFITLGFPIITQQTPVITAITGEQVKNIGESVELNCTVQNVDNFSLAWNKRNRDRPTDSVVLAIRSSLSLNDPRYKLVEDKNETATTYSLGISQVETVDMGIYECQVITSAAEKLTANVELLVKHPPIILESKTTTLVTVAEGSSARLSCNADGYPRPSISWRRQDNAIMPGGGDLFSGNDLKITEANRADRGTYYCIADNGVGTSDEKIVIFEVEFTPEIALPRPKVAQARGYDVDLECKVEAHPAPAVLWYKNGRKILNDDKHEIKNSASANGITKSVLTILYVQDSDYGDYFCNATNKMGQSESRTNLFEVSTPDINYPGLEWTTNFSQSFILFKLNFYTFAIAIMMSTLLRW